MSPPTISQSGAQHIQAVLDAQAETLPGCFLTVVSPTEVLFNSASGKFDVLDESPAARKASTEDVMWFASTTKLITSVCYLQLVDRGVLSLDTKLTELFPPLKAASSRILTGFDADGKPQFRANSEPITLAQMLNQSSGFGREFGPTVQAWKKVTDKGKGFVNSCKAENLIHTPITFEPGTHYEYGNSAEWLALMFPQLGGEDYEEYMQKNLCQPLGMKGTTFYPFGPEWDDRLMPLRFGAGAVADPSKIGEGIQGDGKITWEKLDNQLPLLTLPRSREEIEYPAGGGGIYSKTSDYALLLQHLLRHYLSLSDSSVPAPEHKLLSDKSVASLFAGSLPEAALGDMAEVLNMVRGFEGKEKLQKGEADWTTGMALYAPKDGRRREGWGRRAGSVGWGGAAGTEYWIDPVSGVAAVWTTQMLPGSGYKFLADAKKHAEKAVYEALEK
ncbi:hypothetical protein JCM24511_08377 [Saitozyma sp. JCM 24511]|nr:hypothetical protein JCM24511_08377 [Saitozyma sp. JCM 24511]